jgi:hypothetical protein
VAGINATKPARRDRIHEIFEPRQIECSARGLLSYGRAAAELKDPGNRIWQGADFPEPTGSPA